VNTYKLTQVYYNDEEENYIELKAVLCLATSIEELMVFISESSQPYWPIYFAQDRHYKTESRHLLSIARAHYRIDEKINNNVRRG